MFRSKAKSLVAGKAEEVISKIGAELRRVRTQRGERLEDLAEYLGIKSIYLYGIEQGDLSAIPSRRRKRSYASSYANYLGLDGDAIGERIDAIVRRLESSKGSSSSWGLAGIDRSAMVILGSSVILGVVAGWYYLGDTAKLDLIAAPVTAGAVVQPEEGQPTDGDEIVADEAALEGRVADDNQPFDIGSAKEAEQALAELESKIAEQQSDFGQQASADNQPPADQVAALEQAQTPDENGSKKAIPVNLLATLVAKQGNGAQIYETENTDARVIVRAISTSWIQISSEDRSYLWTRTMQPKEMVLVPNRDDLELWAGDANGVEILLDGAILPTLGPPGTVVRGVSLAPDALEALSETVSADGSSKPTF